MPRTKISEFSATPANNTDIDSINIAEGCAPSGINDAIRELMAQLKDFQTGAVGDSFNGPIGTSTAAAGAFTTLSASSTTTLSGLTASTALALDASKNVVSVTNTGTGSNVLATSPTLVTPILGTPTSATLTNATGLPISTGVSGLGTNVATFLGTPSSANLASAVSDETGSGALVFANSPTLVTPALGTPSSGTLTNATGLPISTGVSGLGTGVATALAVNVGSAGAPVVNGGALGTPSSGTATNLTGLPLTTGVTGTLPTANGGTNLTSFTSGGVVYASSTSALATGANLTFNGNTLTSSNATGANVIFNSTANNPYVSFAESGASKLLIGASAIVGGGGGYDFYGAAGIGLTFYTNASRRLDITSAGDVGIGTSSPTAVGSYRILDINGTAGGYIGLFAAGTKRGAVYAGSGGLGVESVGANPIEFYTNNALRATLDSSGNLLVGTTSQFLNEKLSVITGNTVGLGVKTTGGASNSPIVSWNATDSGDGFFAAFCTETSLTVRGSITYNRAGGLTAYNTTSDYRAKDITGPVTNSGALIDSVPVYMGKMKGATQERPMFIAHETPAYAHTGEKDAVDADGNPVYQQMDASALIPVMWAEIQSLRARVAQLETN